MRALLHLAIAASTVLVLATPHGASGADGTATRYTVGVQGMVCPTSCTNNVRQALQTLPEVDAVAVDFAAKTATITTRAALTREQVHKVLKGSGFGVTTFELQPVTN